MGGSKEYALIVAGGSGTRMQSQVPKQFLLLNGKPILMHTLEAFYCYSASLHIITVLPETDVAWWYSLCHRYDFDIPHRVVKGGQSRTNSVRNGLEAIEEEEGWVAIHDGVRPLISADVIAESFRVAQAKGNAVTSVRLKDSIRRLAEKGGTQAEDREQFRLIQTPQTFLVTAIRNAYRRTPESEVLPDDATLMEKFGEKIHLIEGSYRNIKITTPEDLSIAEAFLRKESL